MPGAVINPCFPDGSSLNYLKLAGSRQVIGGGYAYPGWLDINGYPVVSPENSILHILPLQQDISGYTGNWVMGWTGPLGKFRLNLSSGGGISVTTGAGFVTSPNGFNSSFAGSNGRVVFSFGGVDATIQGYFEAGTYDGTLANLYLCRESEEALYLSGIHTRPIYTDHLAYLDPFCLRFLHAIPMNGVNVSNWDYRSRPEAFSYRSEVWAPGAWVGTIGGTDTYTCSAATDTPGSWTDGEVIQGYVTNANTSTTPTLDCGSRGAKTIVHGAGGAVSVGAIGANSLNTFVYDALLDVLIHRAGAIENMLPLEIAVQVCNQLNKPGWFQVPHLATDAYILAMAQYLYANMNQWFVLELSNEVWNNTSPFYQSHIYRARGAVLTFDESNERRLHGYYAKRFCEMVDIFKTVFGSDSRLRPTLGVQMFGSTSQYDTYRFLGTDLGAYGFNSSPNRPIDKASYVSPASYLNGAQVYNFDANWTNTITEALAAADDYDSGDPARMADALLWLDGDIRAGTRNGSPGGQTVLAVNNKAADWNTVIAGYSKGMLEYEGGLEIAALSTSRCTALGIDTGYSAKFVALIDGYKNSHFAKKLIMDRMWGFMANSSAVAPACWQDVQGGQWGLRSTIYATPFKTEEGFAKFSAGKKNFRLGALA